MIGIKISDYPWFFQDKSLLSLVLSGFRFQRPSRLGWTCSSVNKDKDKERGNLGESALESWGIEAQQINDWLSVTGRKLVQWIKTDPDGRVAKSRRERPSCSARIEGGDGVVLDLKPKLRQVWSGLERIWRSQGLGDGIESEDRINFHVLLTRNVNMRWWESK